MNLAFDNDLYLKLQSKNIIDRVGSFGDKLYLEFGGKLFDDYHASRVLPGFMPDSKLKMLLSIKDDVEVVIAINAQDIKKNKVRSDIGITYDSEVLRLIDAFKNEGLYVSSVCITKYQNIIEVNKFIDKLNKLNIKTYKHYEIEGYPHDISNIISDNGFGKNEYIKTSKRIVVVTAPGPGSGKMATCLSQLYHENKRGIKAGYAKYETFPIWSIPLKHPVNIAYEAATADLADVNMIDPYHLEAYNKLAVNYNRDVEIFPVLKSMFEKIYGTCPYKSPTDMGVNMAGFAIINDKAAIEASKKEIIRRYLNSKVDLINEKVTSEVCDKIALLMKQLDISVSDRVVVSKALEKAKETNTSSMALELNDGSIITSKTSKLLTAPASLILNALKAIAGIDDSVLLLSNDLLNTILDMKRKVFKKESNLNLDDILIALSIDAKTNKLASLAFSKLDSLKGLEAHSSTILSKRENEIFKRLLINLTTEAKYE